MKNLVASVFLLGFTGFLSNSALAQFPAPTAPKPLYPAPGAPVPKPVYPAPGAPAPYGQAPIVPHCGPVYVDQKIIVYKPVYKTKTVPIDVKRLVPKIIEEPCRFIEMVSVMTPEKRIEKYYVCVAKDVPFTYKVCVPTVHQEKRTVGYMDCVQREVTIRVPVCRPIYVQVYDPCTCCVQTVCKYITEFKEVRCPVTVYVPKTKDVTVNVPSIRIEDRLGTMKVLEIVPQSREVIVNVVSCVPIEKAGVTRRLVHETVIDRLHCVQTYCEMVPYEMCIRVPVCCK